MVLPSTNTCIDITHFVHSCFVHPNAVVATHYCVLHISQWFSLESFGLWWPNPHLAIIFVLFVHYFKECLYLLWVVARYRVCLKGNMSELTESLTDSVSFKTGLSCINTALPQKFPSFGGVTQARPIPECGDLEAQRKCPLLRQLRKMPFMGDDILTRSYQKAILVLGRGRVPDETWWQSVLHCSNRCCCRACTGSKVFYGKAFPYSLGGWRQQSDHGSLS